MRVIAGAVNCVEIFADGDVGNDLVAVVADGQANGNEGKPPGKPAVDHLLADAEMRARRQDGSRVRGGPIALVGGVRWR